jgi:hypothetical protein
LAFQLPQACEERAGLVLSERGRDELEVLALELRVGERQVGVAFARRLEMFAAAAVARLERDARRAPGGELRVDRSVQRELDRMSERVPASSRRGGSNAARRTLPCVSAVATR